MSRTRAFACIAGVIGAFALLLQLWLALRSVPPAWVARELALWRYFGYFTILTNLFVVSALFAWASGARGPLSRFLRHPPVQTAAAVAIVIVAVVYHALLSRLYHPHGGNLLADQLLHSLVPVLFVLHWWVAIPKSGLRWAHAAECLAYPAAYAVYALLRGAADGWYPYPFINVTALGYPRVAVNICALAVAIVAVALVFVALGRWQARRLPVATRPG